MYLLNCFAFVGLIANIIYTQNFDFDRCLSCSAEQKRGPFWPPTWTHTVIDTRIYSVWDCVFNVEMLYRDLVCQQSVISYVIASYLYSVVLHAWTQECQHMMPCPRWWIPMTAESHWPAGEDRRAAFATSRTLFEKTYATKQKKRKKSRFWILKKR